MHTALQPELRKGENAKKGMITPIIHHHKGVVVLSKTIQANQVNPYYEMLNGIRMK